MSSEFKSTCHGLGSLFIKDINNGVNAYKAGKKYTDTVAAMMVFGRKKRVS